MPDTSTTLTCLGDAVTVKAISEWDKGKRTDTKILINDILLCYVSGQDYQVFIDKLQNLVNTYRI